MKAYIIYRIALCIHLEVYLMLSILILNETIRADLIVFLALFADVATVAIACKLCSLHDKILVSSIHSAFFTFISASFELTFIQLLDLTYRRR